MRISRQQLDKTLKKIATGVYRIADPDGTPSYFASISEMFSEKTATSMKITPLLEYLVHAAFPSCSVAYRISFLESGLS